MEMIHNNRKDWVDIAKGIGILLMVFGHTGLPSILSKFIWSFHMPLFFFISGFLFNERKYAESPILFMKKMARSLILPYVFFSIIVYMLYIENTRSVVEILAEGWGGIALWFVAVLFFTEILYYIISSVFKSKCSFVFLAILIVTAVGYYFYKNDIHFIYQLDSIGIALFFYGIGNLSKRMVEEIPPGIVFPVIGFIAVFVSSSFFNRLDICSNNFGGGIISLFIALLGVISLLSFSKYLSNNSNSYIIFLKNTFQWLGQNTMVILSLSQVYGMLLILICSHFLESTIYISVIRQIVMWVMLVYTSKFINKYLPIVIGK